MSKILIAVTDTNVGGITTSVYNFSKELSIVAFLISLVSISS